ncbi:MAG TPA: ComEC/Rec2 family competence protein [Gaiellales bacterium]|nr:ComEC/Rec2 family competence protein [Gaiellales bacterium]
MSPSERPAAIVLAADAGLVAAALHRPLLAVLAVGMARSPRSALVLAATAALAVLWGSARVADLDRRALAPGPATAVVTVTGTPNGSRAAAAVAGVGETVVLVAPGTRLEQGGVYRVRGSLRELDPVVRGYYATQGIHLQLRAARALETGRRGGVWGAVDTAHRYVLGRLGASGAPAPARALVAGIALGDIGGLPYEEREQLRASGLYHIVAVSGQNVALLIAFTLVALGVAGVIGTPARLAAGALTAAYVLVSGAGPSIVRAGASGVLVSAAWLASRPAPPWQLLACGAVVVLGFDPLELYDPGFQLSFAAVAAIHLVAPMLREAVGEAAAVSIACTVVTTPIAWWHFGRLTPLAVPANLLALPAVAPILWLATLAAVAGSAWPPLALPFLSLADLLAGYVLWIARALG